jgi:hypothetical protein
MKRALMAVILAAVVSSSGGCCLLDRLFCCNRGCGRGWDAGHGGCGGGAACNDCGSGGMASNGSGVGQGMVTYPYYTNRGPRDFLACKPGDIGP